MPRRGNPLSQTVSQLISVTYPTANALVEQFEKRKVFSKGRGQKRDRVFAFKSYLDLLHEGADDLTGVLAGEDYLVTNSATGVAAAL